MLAATIANLISLPHPLWFTVTAIAVIPFMAWLAGVLALVPRSA